MRKNKILLLLGAALVVAACGNRNDHDDTTAGTGDTAQDETSMYLAYVQKMIAATSDDSEPWDIETVHAEQSDVGEAINVM